MGSRYCVFVNVTPETFPSPPSHIAIYIKNEFYIKVSGISTESMETRWEVDIAFVRMTPGTLQSLLPSPCPSHSVSMSKIYFNEVGVTRTEAIITTGR